MKASEEIRATKELLMRSGWTKHHLIAFDGTRCLVGGVLGAVQPENQAVVLETIWGAIDAPCRHCCGAPTRREMRREIEYWNDQPFRTFDEVCDVLDKAEKLALIAEEADSSMPGGEGEK